MEDLAPVVTSQPNPNIKTSMKSSSYEVKHDFLQQQFLQNPDRLYSGTGAVSDHLQNWPGLIVHVSHTKRTVWIAGH